MKKFGRWICVLLVLALAAGLFGGMTAWAEEDPTPVEGTPVTDGTQQQDVDAGNANNAVMTANNPDDGTATTTGTEPSLSLSSYRVIDFSGNEIYTIPKGTHFCVELGLTTANISGKVYVGINSSSFVRRAGRKEVDVTADGSLSVTVDDIEYLGGSPELTLEISYTGAAGILTQTLTLNQCVDTPDPTPTPAPEPTPEPTYKTPGIIIRESSFGDAPQVQAGAEFTLSLTVFTTSGTENLSDVLITLTLPQGVSLATGNLNTYIGEMGPEATRTVTYQILPSATFVDGVANIGVSMSGIGQNSGGPASGSTSVSVPVVQPERFEITNIEAPETMMLGEEGYVSLTFVNKGKTAINNLSAEIRGDNLANPGQSQFLGNIAAGTENSVDFNVMAEQTGTINATIVLSYEDDAGNVKTLEKTFSCTVEEMPVYDDPGMMDPGMMDPSMGMEEPSGGMPWWGWVLILAAVGGGIAAVVVVLKKRKAKKALAQLEDQDEDL